VNTSKFEALCWLVFFVFALSLIYIFLNNPYYEGDTVALLQGVSLIRVCLTKGSFSCPGIVHFPIFQYIPALIIGNFAPSKQAILQGLALMSSMAFFSSLILIYTTLKKVTKPCLALTAVLIMISSPFLWYAKSTFNEMVATFVTLAFTASVILQSSGWIVAIFSLLTGITKETAFPFVIAIGLVALFPRVLRTPGQCKPQIIGVAIGSLLSVIVNAGFNYFRYGSPFNIGLLQDYLIVHSSEQRLSSFLGIWLSPNGGILFFWTSLFVYFLYIFFILISLVFRYKFRYRYIYSFLPALAILLILFLLTLGFSSWWAPFGGASWGPRLILPWMPSLLLLVLYFYSKETQVALKLIFSNIWFTWASIALLFLASLPQIIVLVYPVLLGNIFIPDSTCPQVPNIVEPSYYYYCLNHLMWTKWPPIFRYREIFINNPSLFTYSLIYFLALSSLAYLALIESKENLDNN
jgi:hypothetical protein